MAGSHAGGPQEPGAIAGKVPPDETNPALVASVRPG